MEIRSDPSAIDGPWLTDALEDAGVARGGKVLDVEYVGDIGTGQTGRNSRLGLTWDDPDGRPASVVCKLPSSDPEAREGAFAHGSYRKEWRFYEKTAATVDIRRPECYLAAYDEATPDFMLLLEDISTSTQGDQLEGLSTDQVALAVEQAVALHAPRFGDPTIEAELSEGMPYADPETVAMVLNTMYPMALESVEERLGDRLDDDVMAVCRDFAPYAGRFFAGTDTPQTLTHLDFRADNLLFGNNEGDPPIVVVDFQTLAAGLGMSDLAYLISGSYPDPADRAGVERDMVEDYRARMAAAGVELSADQCWRDYRFGSLAGLLVTVTATMGAAQTERGDDMLTAMAQRHGQQAIDLDALSLVR